VSLWKALGCAALGLLYGAAVLRGGLWAAAFGLFGLVATAWLLILVVVDWRA